MIAESVKFRGHPCFRNEWSGFETVKPVNVIIGRNNSGKTHLLDLVEAICGANIYKGGWQYSCKGILDEASVIRHFPNSGVTPGQRLPGHPWHQYGKHLAGLAVEWELDPQSGFSVTLAKTADTNEHLFSADENLKAHLGGILGEAKHSLSGKILRRLAAERDVKPEKLSNDLNLRADGHGATNIIRRHLTSSSPKYPPELIQNILFESLNKIFGEDGEFKRIGVRHHDEAMPGQSEDHWEVFLSEIEKGFIPLSRSGSGLKTVILVLLNLLVMPEILQRQKSDFVFAFEELENNLHPALLRRLFKFIERHAVEQKATIFITTHSSVALDVFGPSKNAQIIRVSHDGATARAQTISAHFDQLGIISELGAKPSDLLQANGIIWVEGPSDRVYINRWIELLSDAELREGRDYQCAFYGGALLARTQFTSAEIAEEEMINLLRLNPNVIVVCDGDRTAKDGEGAELKARVIRIKNEVEAIPCGHIWITGAKEIENYLLGSVLAKIFETDALPDPGQYETFFPSDGKFAKPSYIETHLQRKSKDKVELAIQSAPYMTRELLGRRFDCCEQVTKIVERIRVWNA